MVNVAYILSDSKEDEQVIRKLFNGLLEVGITPIQTDKHFTAIQHPGPFLWYGTPYTKIKNPNSILQFHKDNPVINKIVDKKNEPVSINNIPGKEHTWDLVVETIIPDFKPLPILLTAHSGDTTLQKTIDSLRYTTPDPEQKFYIVASAPTGPTLSIIYETLKKDARFTCVLCNSNLGYAVGNFGIKFYGLEKFIHMEDDCILPSTLNYQYPYWTRQFAYRATTADIVSLRTSLSNMPISSWLNHKPHEMFEKRTGLWSYYPVIPNAYPPIGGNGLYVDSKKLYGQDMQAPQYSRSDIDWYNMSRTICLPNIEVYHCGPDKVMTDTKFNYGDRVDRIPSPPRYVTGVDLRTFDKKVIDLVQPYDTVLSNIKVKKQDTAVVTVVSDGHYFIKIWLRYYLKHFNPRDIYLLSFNGDTEKLEAYGINIIPCNRDIGDIQNYRFINAFKNRLLDDYETVIYADYDEILWCDDGIRNGLVKYKTLPYVTTNGFEIIQNRSYEQNFDWAAPVLSQRKYWYAAEQYCKPVICNSKTSWGPGLHGLYDSAWTEQHIINKKDDILLVHLKKIDYVLCRDMAEKHAGKYDETTNLSKHNFYMGDRFEAWWKTFEDQAVLIGKTLLDRQEF